MRIVEELNKGWQVQGFEREKIEFEEIERIKEGWIASQVPGVVHLDLLREKRIADPFYSLKEKDTQWVEKKEWWYKNEFLLDESHWKKKRKVEFIFEGLDTFATIYLNGEKIGKTDNMFIPWRFDVTDKIREKNTLLIKFSSATSVLKKIQEKEGHLKAPFEPARVYGRKAQYCFGWDWGPRLSGVGIWRMVYLCGYDEMHINWVGVEESLLERKAKVKMDVEISSGMDEEKMGKILVYLNGKYVKKKNVRIGLPSSKHILNLEVENPILWYPKGYGRQYLYHLKLELFNGEEELMDVFQDKIGIREVRLIQEKDKEGKSFYFKINGTPVFCKGANWIPADSFLPRVDKDKYTSLIQSASRCGINMFRIWGGGIYEDDEFYRLCDEEGIMVWQDFMFTCGQYPEGDWFLEKVKKEAICVIKSLKNHPCIILWCGNNENHWLYGEKGKLKGRTIYHDILPSICKQIDPTLPYWPGSPYGGKEYNAEEEGDRHNWEVWSKWQDIELYKKDKGRFLSEFGFQAPPVMETIKKFCPLDQLKEDSPSMEHHNKQDDGPARLVRYLRAYMPEPGDFEEFVRYTQLNQAYALKVMIERCRRRKFKCGGTLFWQFNDCWPGISWSVIDHYLRPKPAYYAIKRAFQPVLISLVDEGEKIEIWICNDTLKKVKGRLCLKSMSFEGRVLWTKEEDVFIPSNQSVKVLVKPIWEMGIESRKENFIYASLKMEESEVENHLFLKRERYLKLPSRQFERRVDQSKNGLEIELYSSVFVRAVALGIPGENAEFSDNFFDLIPGVRKRVRLTCSSEEVKRIKNKLIVM
ncbi:glycoside hydrolase family 2 protein [Patescibacteria group bacterium]|nr:glycoside hydrolase family 2 protein [Patescibacteria group bacterium]